MLSAPLANAVIVILMSWSFQVIVRYNMQREKESRRLIEDITVEKSTCTYSICLTGRRRERPDDSERLLDRRFFPISGSAARSDARLRDAPVTSAIFCARLRCVSERWRDNCAGGELMRDRLKGWPR